jgi:hypothetical protein
VGIIIFIIITGGIIPRRGEVAGRVYRDPTGRVKSGTEIETETNAPENIGKGTGADKTDGTAIDNVNGNRTDRLNVPISHLLRSKGWHFPILQTRASRF